MVFAATGAVFETGATTFFSLFDVVITSFFSGFSLMAVFATNSYSSGTGIYAFSLCRNLNDVKGLFLWTGGGKRAGVFEDAGSDYEGVVDFFPGNSV